MSKLEISSSRGPTFSNAPLDLSDLHGIATRGWRYALIGTGLGLLAGLLALSHVAPTYKANVRLVLEHSVNDYLQSNKVTDGPTLGDDRYSQIHIIASESVVQPVIDKLGLAQDPEFGCAVADSNEGFFRNLLRKVRNLTETVKSTAGLKAQASPEHKCGQSAVFKAVSSHLEVVWEAQPLVINVNFESKDPEKASSIANEIAESYINSTLEAKRNAATLASKAMQERLAELRVQAADAERQVLEYKLEHNIVNADPKLLPARQLTGLGDQVASARLSLMDAKFRMEGAQKSNNTEDGRGYIPDNELISRLRNQYLDAQTSAVDMESRVGKTHAATIKLRKRMDEISAAISAERERIAASYAVQYEAAKSKYKELTSTITQVMSEESADGKANAQLRELEGNAERLRSSYSTMLQRVSEANRLENSPVVLPYARILNHAAVPTQTESSKKRLFILASSTFLGLLLGAAMTFLKNSPLGVFRTADQVKDSLGLISLIVPRITEENTNNLTEYALEAPHSRFAESLRLLWSLIRVAQRENQAKVICVVTSLAGEGKTTIAANLASQVSMHAGVKTLLIDADFHQRTLTKTLTPRAKKGLRQAIEQPQKFADYVVKLERSGLDILPCPLDGRLPNAAQLLGSNRMQELIRAARASYELIIIEPPPIALLADFRMLAPFCDGFVFIIEWGKTSQRLVLETFAEVHDFWERVLCVVLNKADSVALRSIERYKGSQYSSYFQGSDYLERPALISDAKPDRKPTATSDAS